MNRGTSKPVICDDGAPQIAWPGMDFQWAFGGHIRPAHWKSRGFQLQAGKPRMASGAATFHSSCS
jgi:hypothetical protein